MFLNCEVDFPLYQVRFLGSNLHDPFKRHVRKDQLPLKNKYETFFYGNKFLEEFLKRSMETYTVFILSDIMCNRKINLN